MEKMDELKVKEILQELLPGLVEDNKLKNKLDGTIKVRKEQVKTYLNDLGLKEFTHDGFTVSVSEIDKSYLDEQLTLNYLKEKGLTDYVKTKEFFDETELIMAAQNGRLNVADLAEFKIPKTEFRINLK